MDKEEIFRHLKVGRDRSIKIDRNILNEYGGIYREITILSNNRMKIDYLDESIIDLGECEITFYFNYQDYERLFNALEEYIGKEIEQWTNYNTKDYECVLEDYNLEDSWNKLKIDFINNKLDFPKGYNEMIIRDIYWRGLYDKELEVDASIEEIEQWFIRKTQDYDGC